MTSSETPLWWQIAAHFEDRPPEELAVGVSGGSDSLGVLIALDAWRRQGGPDLMVFTVDHKLRPESATEAEHVADICRARHIPSKTLVWDGWDGKGNLAGRARQIRYTMLEAASVKARINDLVVAHTMDDLAETFMMRLIRGSGIDGLSAMKTKRRAGRVWLHRPALNIRREALRNYLRQQNIVWCEDPSNDDTNYERIKVRKALAELEPLGLLPTRIAGAANRISEGRRALISWTNENAHVLFTVEGGDVLFPRLEFLSLPRELCRRLLLRAIHWVNNEFYAPRGAAIERSLEAIANEKTVTVQGCVLMCSTDHDLIRVTREYAAVEQVSAEPGQIWDGRWQISGPEEEDAVVRPIGPDGWRQIAHQAQKNIPYQSVIATPSVWVGQELIAAPLVGVGPEWEARLVRTSKSLFSDTDTH